MNDSECSTSPAASPIWTTSDSETYKVGAGVSLCINLVTWVTNSKSATTRYTGSCAAAETANINTLVTNLGTFAVAYRTQQDEMIGTSGSTGLNSTGQINTVAKLVLSKISSSITDLNTLTTKLNGLYKFANDFQAKTTGMVNCLIVRRELVVFSNSFCHEMVINFNQFAEIFMWIGPLVCTFAICMCAAIRCPPLADEEDKQKDATVTPTPMSGQGYVDVDKTQHEQGLGAPNIDNNMYGGQEMTGLNTAKGLDI